MRNGGQAPFGSMLLSCLCSLAQAEADVEHARSPLGVRLGYRL